MPRVATTERLRTPAKPPPPLQTRRPSRTRLMWRKRRGMLRPVVLGAGALLALLLVAGAVRSMRPERSVAGLDERLGVLSALKVHKIRFVGRDKTPQAYLDAALGVARGSSLFGFSLESARARIEKLTWVAHATVERQLPDTVIVTLTERRPIARWQLDHKVNLIDGTGNVVEERDGDMGNSQLPLVVGAEAGQHAAKLIDELNAVPALKTRVDAMVRVGKRRWDLHLLNGIEVMLPEVGEDAAIARLMSLQNSHDLLDRPVRAIDLRLPDRMVVRPIEQATPATPAPGKKST